MPFGTLRPSGRIRDIKHVAFTTCLFVMILGLTGCGFLPFGNDQKTQSPVPPPQYTEVNEQDGMSSSPDGYKQVAAPAPAVPITPPLDPVVSAGPLQLGEEGAMGSLGVNLEAYFDPELDLDTRVKRVERAVSAIQHDLKTLAPPIKRLITVERDIQALVSQLADFVEAPKQQIKTEPVSIPAAMQAPTAMPLPPKAPMAITHANRGSIISGGKQMGGGGVTVLRLRTGEHPDKTRIVLDVNGPPSYRYDLDNAEGLLVIDLPNANWQGKQSEIFKKSPTISSFNVHSMNGSGQRVVMQLKKSTTVKYESVYKPNGKSFYRIVIDLKK